jgi:hypothetical protein
MKRITDPVIELDCTILIRGKKGTSKSTASIGLDTGVAWELGKLRHKPWWYYFNIEGHVKTVDPDGTMDMFTKGVLKKKNSVLLADDISISADARDSMTTQNKMLGKIVTVSRIYQNLLTMNSVYSTHVDKKVRGFADIIIDMIGIHKATRQAIAKVYWYEVNQHTGKEYIKFFTWKGKRIKYFLFPFPPDFLIKPYKKMRQDKTDEFLTDIQDKREKANRPKVLKREQRLLEQFDEHYDTVVALCKEKRSNRYILRACPGLTDSALGKMRAQSGYIDV